MLSPSHSMGPLGQRDSTEDWLSDSLAQGHIDQSQHDTKLRQHRGAPDTVVAPTRDKGGIQVLDGKNMWSPIPGVGPFEDTKQALKKSQLANIVHGFNAGRWKAATSGSKQHYQCAAHVNCPVLMKAAGKPGSVLLYVLDGVAHSTVESHYRRSNAPLSIFEENRCKEMVSQGAKPKEIQEHVLWDALQQPGAKKKPGGGVEGAAAWFQRRPRAEAHRYTATCEIRCPNTQMALNTCIQRSIRVSVRHLCIWTGMARICPFLVSDGALIRIWKCSDPYPPSSVCDRYQRHVKPVPAGSVQEQERRSECQD